MLTHKADWARLAKRLETIQKESLKSGAEPMSMEGIDAEIKAYRQKKQAKFNLRRDANGCG